MVNLSVITLVCQLCPSRVGSALVNQRPSLTQKRDLLQDPVEADPIPASEGSKRAHNYAHCLGRGTGGFYIKDLSWHTQRAYGKNEGGSSARSSVPHCLSKGLGFTGAFCDSASDHS